MATRDIYPSTFDEDVPTTTSEKPETCPECDGRVRTNALETACTECGLLITEQALDRGVRSVQYDREQRRTGAPRTVAQHDRGLSTLSVGPTTARSGRCQERGAIIAIEHIQDKADGKSTIGCDNHWCDGPESESLPCFECFDPTRNYEHRRDDRQETSR